MKKIVSLVLALVLVVSAFAVGSAAAFTPGEYEGSAQGFGGAVTVKVTVDAAGVTAAEINAESETPDRWRCRRRGR